MIPTVDRILSAPIALPPQPWTRVTSAAVGGLQSVGYAPETDLLLVTSAQGRGVFDGLSGKRIARDPDEDFFEDRFNLNVAGIGPLAGQLVRMAGIYGGGLPTSTADGWQAERLVLQWPTESLLLVPPGSWIYGASFNRPAAFTKVYVDTEIRAWGFSPTGRSLVLATSSDVTIYAR